MGSESISDEPHGTAVPDGPPITATLAVEPPPEADCVVVTEAEHIDIENHNLTFSRTGGHDDLEDGTCNTKVVEEDEGVFSDRYVRSDVETGCFCLVFHEVDCVPSIERVQGGRIVVSVLLPDRDTLRELVSRLRENGSSVDVYGITQSSVEGSESVVMDVTDITDKQREALMIAVEEGYYDTPRNADLEVLADRLDISKSAVSQRLKSIESKLLHKLVDHWSFD
ncbi:MAG: helix-turn-helix domain-containing protein [Halapricum sp.]